MILESTVFNCILNSQYLSVESARVAYIAVVIEFEAHIFQVPLFMALHGLSYTSIVLNNSSLLFKMLNSSKNSNYSALFVGYSTNSTE